MIKKIIFTTDFLFHSENDKGTYHFWTVKLFATIIESVTGIKIEELKNLGFSRDEFYRLSGILNTESRYYTYDISKITKESVSYLKSFIDKETLVICVELGIDLRNILNNLGVNFINFWFHSYKLFDDTLLMINTNNCEIFKLLNNYKVPQEQFYFYANYWQTRIIRDKTFNDSFLEDNSAVFIAQTYKDKSVEKDKKFLNILDYKDEIENLSKKYNKIYYIAHPLCPINDEIKDYINAKRYLIELTDFPTYFLLASNKIKEVISISSSVLYEAQFFNKKINYLYKPLFNIDGEFGLNTFISVYNDYFNPSFWSSVLAPVTQTGSEVLNRNLFFNHKNKLRDAANSYMGYKFLSPVKQLETTVNELDAALKLQKTHISQLQKSIDKLNAIKYNVYPKHLIQLLSCFIFDITKRKAFRKKYSRI
ncbi:MAG: alpha-2,8-polysialyltransferase family protein [Endomicrobium sp.]|jgi:hypothetical protein|nr:alpha-2,8-polysialyltransferase family protein [Endomicrobium sp.]